MFGDFEMNNKTCSVSRAFLKYIPFSLFHANNTYLFFVFFSFIFWILHCRQCNFLPLHHPCPHQSIYHISIGIIFLKKFDSVAFLLLFSSSLALAIIWPLLLSLQPHFSSPTIIQTDCLFSPSWEFLLLHYINRFLLIQDIILDSTLLWSSCSTTPELGRGAGHVRKNAVGYHIYLLIYFYLMSWMIES